MAKKNKKINVEEFYAKKCEEFQREVDAKKR
jgi:hypothetical protein